MIDHGHECNGTECTCKNQVYEAFIEELNAMKIMASEPAVHVVAKLTRAVKRAQLVIDGQLPRVADRTNAP